METKAQSIAFFPEQASAFAGDLDKLYMFLVGVSVFFTLAIAIAIVVLALRYHRRKALDRGADVHGSNLLEIVWSVIPLILAMVMFFWAAKLYFTYSKPPEDSMEILVTGKQWMWKIQHPNGKREENVLHVPLGRPVKLTMTSEDVIHSFYIPAFRVKADVVPGRYTKLWFTPTREGHYHLFCAEYCGTEHSEMVGYVEVMTPARYEEWLSDTVSVSAGAVAGTGGGGGDAPAAAGEKLFTELGCIACHSGMPGALGPDIKQAYGRERTFVDGSTAFADENYLRNSILNPQSEILQGYAPIMPVFKGMVSEDQLMQLIAYIKSVTVENTPGEQP